MELSYAVKPGLSGAVAVGSSGLGWSTAATSEKPAQDTARTLVVAAPVPFCVSSADPNLATLAKLQTEQSSHSRPDILLRAGWSTVGGDTTGSDNQARV
jgi:hypothetical protein